MAQYDTPRQRQYRVAIDAQLHTLATDQQNTLYNLAANVPPPGEQAIPAPNPNPRGRWQTAVLGAVAFTNLLTSTLAPDVLPPGQEHLTPPPVARRQVRVDQPANLQPTLYNLTANVPPNGRETFPEPPRRRPPQQPDTPPNLLTTTLADSGLPPGGELLSLPVPRRRNVAALEPARPPINPLILASINITFTLAANGDDGYAEGSGAAYPPSASTADSAGSDVIVQRGLIGGTTYFVRNGLYRWDTSSLVGATIVGAELRLSPNSVTNTDDLSLVGEWYDTANWPIDSTDFTATPSATAISGRRVAEVVTGRYNLFGLDNSPANLNLSGYTGLRLHITDTTPTGNNALQIDANTSAGRPPRLVVTFIPAPLPDGRGHLALPVPRPRLRPLTDPPNLLTTTLDGSTTLPDGERFLTDPVRRIARVALPQDALNLQPTLYNLAANVPPDGERTLPEPVRALRWVQIDPVPNLLTGTLTPVETLPDGERLLPDPVRRIPRVALPQDALNLQPTLYNLAANIPPDGERTLPEPLRRVFRPASDPVPSLLVTTLAVEEAQPAGERLLPDRLWAKVARIHLMHQPLDLHPTLFNLAANVPPVGKTVSLDRYRVRPGLPVAQQQVFSTIPGGLDVQETVVYSNLLRAGAARMLPVSGGSSRMNDVPRGGSSRMTDPPRDGSAS